MWIWTVKNERGEAQRGIGNGKINSAEPEGDDTSANPPAVYLPYGTYSITDKKVRT